MHEHSLLTWIRDSVHVLAENSLNLLSRSVPTLVLSDCVSVSLELLVDLLEDQVGESFLGPVLRTPLDVESDASIGLHLYPMVLDNRPSVELEVLHFVVLFVSPSLLLDLCLLQQITMLKQVLLPAHAPR